MQILFLFGGGAWDKDAQALGADYENRLTRTEKISVRLIESKETASLPRRNDESIKILKSIEPNDFVMVFDERGEKISSEKFSQIFAHAEMSSKRVVCVVGGAYGINDNVRKRANVLVAFSDMIFPHDLARIMVLEQTYRARSITSGSKYHHAG